MTLKTTYRLNNPVRAGNRWLALLLLCASPFGLVEAVKFLNGPAAPLFATLALVTMVGSGLALAQTSRPRWGTVKVDEMSITFDGDTIWRADVRAAYFSPGVGKRGPSVRLLGEDERELAWIGVEDREAGDRLLEELSLVPTRGTMRFDAVAWLRWPRVAFAIACCLTAVFLPIPMMATIFGVMFAVAAVSAAYLVPARIRVGVDGLMYTARSKSRFFAWSDVARIGKSTRGMTLKLTNGETVELPIALRRIRTEPRHAAQASLVSAAKDARREAQRQAAPDATARLARNGRADEVWIKSLLAEGSFREAQVRVEDLWKVVESPAAEGSARAGAAAVLAQEASDEDRARLRIAADACAEPRLRVVLDNAAKGDSHVLAALGDIEDPDDDDDETRQAKRPP